MIWTRETFRSDYAQQHDLPHYSIVPKDPLANLEFRRTIWARAKSDPGFQHEQMLRCARDLLYFVNTYCVLFEPRKPLGPAVFPFLTYDFQDDTLLEVDRKLGREDIPIEKSRDMGASFMVISGNLFRQWLFVPRSSFLLVSRNEGLVDSATEPDTLFYKLDLQLSHLPHWMIPPFTRTFCHLANPVMHSVFHGETTTEDLSAGGRWLVIVMDEYARFKPAPSFEAWSATMPSTNCRIPISSAKGAIGKFYELMNPGPGEPPVDKIRLFWDLHPEHRRGLYQYQVGKLEILDREYVFAADYPFKLDGKLRSVAYDFQEARQRDPRFMAQEWDIDYIGAGAQAFDRARVEEAQAEYAQPATERGDLLLVGDELAEVEKFSRNENGHLSLWVPLTAAGRPPEAKYIVGADISLGVGATNSTAFVIDKDRSEQVAELVTNKLNPGDFAILVVALCEWFHGALLNWETNGVGSWFGKKVGELGYTRLWYRRSSEEALDAKIVFKPGWKSSPTTKDSAIGQFVTAALNGDIICRSRPLFEEIIFYRHTKGGMVSGSMGRSSSSDEASKENLSDRVTGGAVCYRALGTSRRRVAALAKKRQEPAVPVGSLAHRRKYRGELAEGQEQRDRWY